MEALEVYPGPAHRPRKLRRDGGTVTVAPIVRRTASGEETVFWLRREDARTAQRWSERDAQRLNCSLTAFVEARALQIVTPAEALNKRQRAKLATQAALTDAARFLFANAGYFATGIRDVADRMGMSTGAVFANVESKEALWTLAMGGPAPDPALAEQVALIQAQRKGWGWVLRFNGSEHLAALSPPPAAAVAMPAAHHYSGRGATPAEALRQARLSAERGDADRLRDCRSAVQ